jgi:hypothetical protein
MACHAALPVSGSIAACLGMGTPWKLEVSSYWPLDSRAIHLNYKHHFA